MTGKSPSYILAPHVVVSTQIPFNQLKKSQKNSRLHTRPSAIFCSGLRMQQFLRAFFGQMGKHQSANQDQQGQ